MLTVADIRKLLTAGAGPRIDILPLNNASVERMSRSLVALANAQGGILLVPLLTPKENGPDSDGEPIQYLERAMQAMLLCEPHLIIPLPYLLDISPATQSLPTQTCMVVEVPDGLPHVYGLDGRYLARNHTRIMPLGVRALRALMLTRSEEAWESCSPRGCSQDDLDWQLIESYAANAISVGNSTVEELLLRRGCVIKVGRKTRPTNAGLLLFGKQPQRWVRGAEILAVRFMGTSMDDVFTRQTISSTLPDQIRRTELFIYENLVQRTRVGSWQRQDEAPYPPGALREAVVNAVAHRDYRLNGGQIHVLIYANRVEVRSPGKLPGHVTLQNLLHERYSRNETIVQVLADMGFIERLGYGIDRMVRIMKERGHQPPRFEETDAGFAVTLFAKGTSLNAQDSQLQPAPYQRIEKMLGFMSQNGRINSREYQDLCPDVSAESLRRDFVDMVERGMILRVGDKRGTYYILK